MNSCFFVQKNMIYQITTIYNYKIVRQIKKFVNIYDISESIYL